MLPSRDVVCLSHLRWDFVFQRPQQLLTRCAREQQVLYIEPPELSEGVPRLELRERDGVQVAVPLLPEGMDERAAGAAQRKLLDGLLAKQMVRDYVLWYYTPMALDFSRHLTPALTVYDCMDELSAFAYSPPALVLREAELLRRADLVFTGGQSLYEAKQGRHPSVHLFPSSVDWLISRGRGGRWRSRRTRRQSQGHGSATSA